MSSATESDRQGIIDRNYVLFLKRIDPGNPLVRHVDLPPEPDRHEGICSDRRWARIAEMVGELEVAEPSDFAPNGDGPASARRHLRYLACLIPEDVPDDQLAWRVHEVVGNTRLPIELVRSVLEGGSRGELPATTLRTIAGRLRRGDSYRKIAAEVGVDKDTALSVSQWLGHVDARRQWLARRAREAVRQGLTVRQFAERLGIGRWTAQQRLAEARQELDGEAEVVA